jgi:hypothetical protein
VNVSISYGFHKKKKFKFNFVPQPTSGRLATQQQTRQSIKRRKKWEGSYSPKLPLIEEAPGHEPSGLRI